MEGDGRGGKFFEGGLKEKRERGGSVRKKGREARDTQLDKRTLNRSG